MREVFQTELKEVQTRLIEIAKDSTHVMELASAAFLNSDVSLADQALASADAINEKALSLDESVIRILARQSPVSRDLRILVSALRLSAWEPLLATSLRSLASATQVLPCQARLPQPSRKWVS